jgi:hypothetical protein
MTNKKRIFISHSSKDNEVARIIVDQLEREGHEVWYDEKDLGYGPIRSNIEAVFPTCQVFMVLLSPDAVSSPWVNREINAAMEQETSKGMLIVPALLKHCQIPPFLSDHRRLDFTLSRNYVAILQEFLSVLERKHKGLIPGASAGRSVEQSFSSPGSKGGQRFQGVSAENFDAVNLALNTALNSVAIDSEKGQAVDQGPAKLPTKLEEVRSWYRKLSDIEQCFVQATAVLSGASVSDIRKAANELYKPIREAEEHREGRRLALLRVQIEDTPYVPPSSSLRALDAQFLEKTYTTIRTVDGARRLFWQDTNEYGFSALSKLVLTVIEEEVPIGSQFGQSFLQQLELVSKQFDGVSAWRILHTMGELWLSSDVEELIETADRWARSESSDDWWNGRVASLLDGAYDAEYAQMGDQADQAIRSVVLNMLSGWTGEAHSSSDTALCARLGSAVAGAYGMIGQTLLQPALRGLEELMQFPLPVESQEFLVPVDVFASTVLSYATLARFGSAREVLARLASNTDQHAHRRRDRVFRNPRAYLAQRLVTLDVAFFTLIVLAAYSYDTFQGNTSGRYGRSWIIPEHPLIPDEQGRDVLLAGILTKTEPIWRQHIATLLCGMLVEGGIDQTLLLMRNWAETVLKERGPGCLELRSVYLRFMVDVIHQAEQWCSDLRNTAYRSPMIIRPCMDILEQWRLESRHNPQPLGALAKDVQNRIRT